MYKQSNIDLALQNALYAHPDLHEKMLNLQEAFIKDEWRAHVQQEIENEYDSEDPEYQTKIEKDYLKLLYQEIRKSEIEHLTKEVKESLIRYVQAYSIIEYHYNKYREAIRERNMAINDQIMADHSFRSRNQDWFREKKQEQIKSEVEKLEKVRD